MDKYRWNRMSALKLGRYAEHLTCMELLAFNFDVYTVDVDDHGIDLIVRKENGSLYEFQVKSSRNLNYIFFPKAHFTPRDSLYGVVVLFNEGIPPQIYLIPSSAWCTPNALLIDRDYDKEGQTSKPEWGVYLTKRNLPLLEPYKFDEVVQRLFDGQPG
jgi:hypothetical protein